jgi:LPXTG-motif cell wall-anchored protein
MKAELTREPRGNTATFRFKHQDGSYGSTHSAELDPSWRAQISGRSYRLRDLARGQELDLYLPPDRFAVHVHASDAEVTTIAPVAVVAAEPEPEPEPASMLPATASKMPLFALFGALALLGAGMLRVARRQA